MKERLWVCLPGFLGLASDFHFIEEKKWVLQYFVADSEKIKSFALEALASFYVRELQLLSETHTLILVGYSFGARLALYMVYLLPLNFFYKIFLISCSTCNLNPLQRRDRYMADLRWASLFLEHDWDDVVSQWNAQSVFDGTFHPVLQEQNFSKTHLSQCLQEGSVALQPYVKDLLSLSKLATIMWILGQRDIKCQRDFYALSENVPSVRGFSMLECGHRVLHDAKGFLFDILKRML